MKQPVKHDVKRSTVFAGTAAILLSTPETRRFFEHTRSMPGAFVPPYGASDPDTFATFGRMLHEAVKHDMKHGPIENAGTLEYFETPEHAKATFDRAMADVDQRIREIAGRQIDMPAMPDFSALKPAIEAAAVSMSRAVATFCNAVKHDMKHAMKPSPNFGGRITLSPKRLDFDVEDPEPNGIRVTHERHVSPWCGASGRQRWVTTHRAECRIRTCRGRRRK